ncbi:hypothetical protein TWF696_009574 [Orbilia brochopaga]|uniref:Uncharacterized protein n=1 Tax=Orbilia brochopaga TaxID=3140254 RepID=A0AAV9UF68_9PEZI
MKISLPIVSILAATSSLLTAVSAVPVTSNKTLKLMACSGELEGVLASKRWPPIITDEVLREQQEYLRVNSFKLPDCKPFEYATLEDCITLGKQAADPLPIDYVNHLCVLLHCSNDHYMPGYEDGEGAEA